MKITENKTINTVIIFLIGIHLPRRVRILLGAYFRKSVLLNLKRSNILLKIIENVNTYIVYL